MTISYTIDSFVADMSSLVSAQNSEATILERGEEYLIKLLANPHCIREEFCVPVGRGSWPNHGTYILHRGPSVFVTAVVWGPGDSIYPHNHGTWGIIGVARNAIQESRYERLDGGLWAGPARLRRRSVRLLKQGEVSVLKAGRDEIHRLDNFSDRSTVEIHAYGKDLVGLPRVWFDEDKNTAVEFQSTHYDNC